MVDKKVRVLYVVGRDVATSVPLEVASCIKRMHLSRLSVMVASYYAGGEGTGGVVSFEAQNSVDWQGVNRLARQIRSYRPDVLHVHHTVSAFWGAVLGRLMGTSAIIRTEHSSHQHCNIGQNLLNFVTQLLSTCIVCNSDHTYQQFHAWEKRVATQKSITVHNGVDVGRVNQSADRSSTIRRALGFSPEHIVIGNVGRLIEIKNHETLLRALPNIVAKVPRARILLVGGGPKRARLEEVVQSLGMSEHVFFTGAVARSRVYELLHAMDLFVVPSLSEGFCNAAVEAMASGLPLVCSDIRVLHEVVGPIATYVDPTSPREVAAAVRLLVEKSSEEIRHIGQAARKRVEARFTIQKTARAYISTYMESAQGLGPSL